MPKNSLKSLLSGSAVFLALAALLSLPTIPTSHAKRLDVHQSAVRQEKRQKYIRVEWLLDQLALKPDMNIVDIGAGPGQVSFLMADKIKGGKGKVFATDILPDRVAYVAEEARKRGFPNVVSVKVRPEGLDPFYLKQRYDLIYLSNAYHGIDSPVQYFKDLRGQLNPGGRVVVVIYRHEPIFTTDDILHLRELAGSMMNSPKEDPLSRHISEKTRSLVHAKGREAELAQSIINDFNAILGVPGLYKHFLRESLFPKQFASGERALADWLILEMRENGTLDLPLEKRDPAARRALAKLNRLFLVKRWGMFLVDGGQGVYAPYDDPARYTSRVSAIRELGEAGFVLSEEKPLSAYFEALIFTSKEQ